MCVFVPQIGEQLIVTECVDLTEISVLVEDRSTRKRFRNSVRQVLSIACGRRKQNDFDLPPGPGRRFRTSQSHMSIQVLSNVVQLPHHNIRTDGKFGKQFDRASLLVDAPLLSPDVLLTEEHKNGHQQRG